VHTQTQSPLKSTYMKEELNRRRPPWKTTATEYNVNDVNMYMKMSRHDFLTISELKHKYFYMKNQIIPQRENIY
jgi:hypothetical protein